jgi:hypothetical protein
MLHASVRLATNGHHVHRRALARESELALRDQIRRLLALPMRERMNFLRVRVGRGTAL